MRRLPVLIAFFCCLALPGSAQAGLITIICDECRDPHKYPADWANFAFNQIYGEEAWLNWDQGNEFFLVNRRGHRVYVDIDFKLGGIQIAGLALPFWPKNLVQITLALPNGTIVKFIRNVNLHPLPVPSPRGPGDQPSGSSDKNDSEDGIDDDHLSELPEPDDLPEMPEWCEEC